MRRNDTLYRMIVTAVLLGVGLVLPLLTGQLQSVGKLLSPLHIPAFICGLTCGWLWGGVLGLILPVLRMVTFGMPAAPMAWPMAFELCAYGVVTGALYPFLRCRLGRSTGKQLAAMVIALVAAMVRGRVVGGCAKALLLMLGLIPGVPLTFGAFLTAYFAETAVGAAVHLVIVPAVVVALEKAKLSPLARMPGA